MLSPRDAAASAVGKSPVVGVDIGGSKVAALLVDDRRAVLHRVWLEHGGGSFERLLACVEAAVTECRARARQPVAGVGVAVAGWLAADRQRLIWGANLHGRDVPIGAELAARLGMAVRIENDGNAAALAEYRAASARPHSLVLLVLGTGVAGGIVVDGRPVVGASGLAGELGHLPVTDTGEVCICGGTGCLELLASGPGLARAAGKATGMEVVRAAVAGDKAAAAVLARAGDALGRAVAQLLPVVDPSVVLLGGSLAHAAADHLLPALHRRLERVRPLSAIQRVPVVELGRLGPDAGALGAAELVLAPPELVTDAVGVATLSS